MDLNEQTNAEEWRAGWAEVVNAVWEQRNISERVDHRSYERQGEQVPTIHLGVVASQMEKRGIDTERGNMNREIEVTNQRLRQLRAQLVKLQNWLKEEAANTEPPTLTEVIQGILERREQAGQSGRFPYVLNSKGVSKMLDFLQENNITDMAGLDKKVKSMFAKQADIRGDLKFAEQRMKTLDENIQQAGIYLAHKELYAQYRKLKPRKQPKFYEEHHADLMMFEAAARYLKGVVNGQTTLPTSAWNKERDELAVERSRLNREYGSLKGEVAEVWQIQRSIHDIVREENRRAQPQRAQGMEI